MFVGHEHRQGLRRALRTSERLARSHRAALDAERRQRARQRAVVEGARHAHRAALRSEREQIAALRQEHKAAAAQLRWLVALAERVAAMRAGRGRAR
ncbi:MAG: hypothetical protein QN174_08615 [Armatimonadota bacterium]|nr:hypothetical protein [Armatimonadota bacterium]MDR7452949.1 hypothetical protein [Armatimonadota bacterium]MDR7456349.1 hypothetical protein [Armatimonadota bacterium]MDR7497006.1 hypothetical protein [Armatimonadota bacterium]MDR7511178.1 hypothetical protein [Armatimonadota bacterium]